MAMNDATKRKEPEPETPAASSAAKEDAPAVEEKKTEPDAKRLKPTPLDPATVRKQVEYYLSDENLKYDKFFHEKISTDSEGWLDMSLVLSCNKMKGMRATKEDVLVALKDSKLELKEGGVAVRRPGNAALPKLESKPMHQKKTSLHAHDGGIMAVFKNLPEEQSWMQLKEKLKAAMPPKASLWFVSEVSEKNQCFVATAPFDGDAQFFEELELDLGGAKLKALICQGELLQQGLKLLPKHIRERREKESRKRQRERNRPIVVGTQRFVNVGALRGRVKEIINSRSDGEHLKPDGSDFKLIKALLEFHPKGPEKFKGMVGIKVDQSTQGENRCFFMVKEDGTAEDFSAKKCLDAIETNPPYVKVETAKKKEDEDAGASTAAAGEATKAAKTTEAPAKEEKEKAAPDATEKEKTAAETKATKTTEAPAKEEKEKVAPDATEKEKTAAEATEAPPKEEKEKEALATEKKKEEAEPAATGASTEEPAKA